MSKTTKPEGILRKDASPDLLARVKSVLAQAENHIYSVSKVYGVHNEIFGLTETPESCATCLQTRANNIDRWNRVPTSKATVTGSVDIPTAPPPVEPTDGVVYSEADALAQANKEAIPNGKLSTTFLDGRKVEFTATTTNPLKGTIVALNGKSIKPGTYGLADGRNIVVQPGGKATIKEESLI